MVFLLLGYRVDNCEFVVCCSNLIAFWFGCFVGLFSFVLVLTCCNSVVEIYLPQFRVR